MIAVGVDVGGTFTDLVLANLDTGSLMAHKVPSTNDNPARAVVAGIEAVCDLAGISPNELSAVFHGTTVATNAMLENKGACVGLMTNEGFRDVLHIGRHQRCQHYSIIQDLPWQSRPLVRRQFRKGIGGRLDAQGQELEALDEDAVRRTARQFVEQGVDAIVIGFLFSYINPEHEQRAAAIVAGEAPGIFVTTSSEVAPQFREFERFTTAAISAFVGPAMRDYVNELERALAGMGVNSELRIMSSNGGVATPAQVSRRPAMTLLSGLVAGVRAGAWVGVQLDRRRLITLDIGGTSADIGIVQDGALTETDARSASIAGFPMLLPMVDIHTIGAGGGSIAYRDKGGAFRVGPRSAGASPGPAAYGVGGEEPTVTDANLVLGRLSVDDFLGGRMNLDHGAAVRVIDRLADELGRSREETAEGVLTVLNSNMANAIRSRTVQKGIDPRDFTLAGFGGGGPLQAAEVATLLGMSQVLIPPHPGITSAMGLLTSDLQYDVLRTAFEVKGSVDVARVESLFLAMEAELHEQFERDQVPASRRSIARLGELRYVGQGYELQVAFSAGEVNEASLSTLWAAFHEKHRIEYGHAFENSPIEMVTLKVRGVGVIDKLERLPAMAERPSPRPVAISPCVFRVNEALQSFDTPRYRRADLRADETHVGPAILLQEDSTTVVPPGWRFTSDVYDNLMMQYEA